MANRYRFSGTNLPVMMIDGFEYYCIQPKSTRQPEYYQKPYYSYGESVSSGVNSSYKKPETFQVKVNGKSKLYPFIKKDS